MSALNDCYEQDIELNAGATFKLSLTGWTINNVAVNLAGCTAKFQMLPAPGSSVKFLELTQASGITLSGSDITVTLTDTQVAALSGQGVFSLYITFTDGTVRRLLKGKWTVVL